MQAIWLNSPPHKRKDSNSNVKKHRIQLNAHKEHQKQTSSFALLSSVPNWIVLHRPNCVRAVNKPISVGIVPLRLSQSNNNRQNRISDTRITAMFEMNDGGSESKCHARAGGRKRLDLRKSFPKSRCLKLVKATSSVGSVPCKGF